MTQHTEPNTQRFPWGWVLAAAIAIGVVAMSAGGNDHSPPSYNRTDVTIGNDGVGDLGRTQRLLDIVWDDMAPADRRSVCSGVATFGVDWGAAHIVDGSDGTLNRADARAFLRRKC